jgi:D-alanyl-D-alanine carboxypeptidase/D-alanyl-D-alanine-endopeptidase (penicillin-binding protein 4)
VARAVGAAFAAPGLGTHVSVSVIDATSGAALYRRGATGAVIPASTMKLVTAFTALTVLPPTTRFTTTLVASGDVTGGVLTGDLVLIGEGDPTLSSVTAPSFPLRARLTELADAVRRRGITRVAGGVVVDSGAFTGPTTAPGWKPTYVTEGSVAPITALMVDGGQAPGRTTGARSPSPDLAAGRRFVELLAARVVRVTTPVRRGRASAPVTELGSVQSPPLPALVERMLLRSDNNIAEALLRRSAVARGKPASFAGGVQIAMETLTAEHIPVAATVLRDGSGLSRSDRLTTGTLAAVVRAAADPERPRLRPILSGLPVAGFSGTLAGRYRTPATIDAAGRVRAKTGTLDNVTTLAGIVLTRSGQLIAFAVSADRVPARSVVSAARALDAAVATLARCGCG